MAFKRGNLAPVETAGNTSLWAYETNDTSLNTLADGYFNDAADVLTPKSGIIIMSRYGTFTAYVSSVVNGDVNIQISTTPTLEGDIVGQNEITTVEIETILTSYGISLPLRQGLSIMFHDPDQQPDAAFLCTYDQNLDQWYYEKMTPAS